MDGQLAGIVVVVEGSELEVDDDEDDDVLETLVVVAFNSVVVGGSRMVVIGVGVSVVVGLGLVVVGVDTVTTPESGISSRVSMTCAEAGATTIDAANATVERRPANDRKLNEREKIIEIPPGNPFTRVRGRPRMVTATPGLSILRPLG
jgi:hypothetical protein